MLALAKFIFSVCQLKEFKLKNELEFLFLGIGFPAL